MCLADAVVISSVNLSFSKEAHNTYFAVQIPVTILKKVQISKINSPVSANPRP
jgi:hypothetical protein